MTDLDRLNQLKGRLLEFTTPDKQTSRLLDKINEDMAWAIDKFIKPGLSPSEVQGFLGTPSVTLGEPGEERMDWLYPCLQPAGEESRVGDWFYFFRFEHDALVTIQQRTFLFTH